MFRPLRQASVLIHREDDTITIANTDTGAVIVCNPSAARILELCDGQRDLQAIIAKLDTEFPGAEAEQLAKDVPEFLAVAEELQLIVDTIPRTEGRSD